MSEIDYLKSMMDVVVKHLFEIENKTGISSKAFLSDFKKQLENEAGNQG